MYIGCEVREGEYYDSVKLMVVSQKLMQLEGIDQVGVFMGTPLNMESLKRLGLYTDEIANATADNLVISIRGESEDCVKNAIASLDDALHSRGGSEDDSDYRPRTIDSAVKMDPGLNIALVSVPGRFAAKESMKALQKGLHVMVFSDNVSLDEEHEMKTYAVENNLLLMGPDCGTAMINGVPLGFCNKVRSGDIGLIAASGTGLQEVMSLISNAGGGVSQAIGTGGRDLSEKIGGLMMKQALCALEEDAVTKVIVLISKPPAKSVEQQILSVVREQVSKPVIINFIGSDSTADLEKGRICFASTFDKTALKAVACSLGESVSTGGIPLGGSVKDTAAEERRRHDGNPGNIRGLYSGGTLCYEAMHILKSGGVPVFSNIAHDPDYKVEQVEGLKGNVLLDLGDDAFTSGRAHPMIDPSLREEIFIAQARDPDVGVILLDCVLGYGSHGDPSSVFAPLIARAKKQRADNGKHLSVVVTICGTDLDPQDYCKQAEKLKEAGAAVVSCNADAARMVSLILGGENDETR